MILSELDGILSDEKKYATMSAAARKFARPDSAAKIAREILEICK
jgi:UDP-N-acetylglucosamine:LPS N-acetylglucosamine transferase